ncbi:unnamed protein product [Fusarium graminearum]|uniref:Chromosome 2, complete genome n=1 Tax=Gibberella zeae (strain ATCC MYA-4620 / CBS 123657 / FGSC 9075 / NRRL 31084 / PH-1) TaxID=229533 RepID=A0A0E0S682_GIBZE|nr:hypothetical protein FG05_35104 [Fusarium graminearum]CEF79007.1 unnamed protein product [Fusarium graminearum]CZS82297.1 unnamed protein product [Fusarium graminearum]
MPRYGECIDMRWERFQGDVPVLIKMDRKYALCHVTRRNPQMAEDVFEQAARLVNFQMISCGKKTDILSNSECLDSTELHT